MDSLIQVIYVSTARGEPGEGELARILAVDVIAEGVEKVDEYAWLRAEGISLFQGWLFGEPMFERLPGAVLPRSG